ncbi:MAG: DNA replication/repair protein RecF [Bacteroidales bacterium]|nr:DNA replication/repair protein RecF [Bacteroidales bacterium]
MYLKNIKLTGFKNYDGVEADLSQKINCFVGNNGVGKTNLLDAVYYLSFCKSYFNSIDNQNIKYGEPFFAIHGTYIFPDSDEEQLVSCVLKRGSAKQMKINKKANSRFADHIGKIPLVMISPYDQDLINSGSDVRRKFIDGIISQTDKQYLEQLLDYQKVLEQRNTLLKQFYENRYFDEPQLALWDEQLVRFGQPVYESRKAFVSEFETLFQHYFGIISPSDEKVSLAYESQLDGGDFATMLREAWQKDAYTQYTTVGTHKDDLVFRIDGDMQIKKFGSQGQQKTFVVALKLAQFEYIASVRGVKPILLLDDVFDKLDLERVRQLVYLVGSDRFGQVFLTDTQQGRVESIFENTDIEHAIFTVKDNNIEQQ